jgi:hypothetical protein
MHVRGAGGVRARAATPAAASCAACRPGAALAGKGRDREIDGPAPARAAPPRQQIDASPSGLGVNNRRVPSSVHS